MQCGSGLRCYTFGRYCSKACSTDADCGALGANYSCYVAMTGGGFPGGGMMGGGMMTGTGGGGAMTGTAGMGTSAGTTSTGTGVCRITCTGTSDTSCPSGLMCMDVGGGFGGGMMMMGGGTFRCVRPRTTGGMTGGMTGGTGGRMGGFFMTGQVCRFHPRRLFR